MKKLTTIIKQAGYITIGILLVLTLATAGVLIARDRTISVSREKKQALEDINLESYDVVDYEIDDLNVERCLTKRYCYNISVVDYDDVEREQTICKSAINMCKRFFNSTTEERDNWEEGFINTIAENQIDRTTKNKTKIDEGEVTINAKK